MNKGKRWKMLVDILFRLATKTLNEYKKSKRTVIS